MAITGYLMFRNDTQSQVTLNLLTKKISTKIAIYTTLLNPISKHAIIITAFAMTIEDNFFYNNNK